MCTAMVEGSQKLKAETPYGLAIPCPDISSKDGKSVHTDVLTNLWSLLQCSHYKTPINRPSECEVRGAYCSLFFSQDIA